MKPEDLKKLVAQPESEQLEFKSRLPDTRRLATLIAAFANTNGGRLVVGVRDDGSIVGLDEVESTRLQIRQSLRAISPSVQIETETINIDGRSVLAITIPKGSQSPYLVVGQAFQRVGVGNRIAPITSQVLYSSIAERAKSLDDLRAEVKRLSGSIETLNSKLIVALSWKTRMFDMLLGGIIGAAISFLIPLVLRL